MVHSMRVLKKPEESTLPKRALPQISKILLGGCPLIHAHRKRLV